MTPSLRCLLLAALGAALADAALAQTPAQVVATDAGVARRDMVTASTGLGFSPEPDYAPPSPADDDLGEQRLLVPDARYKSLTLFANASEFYTSNAALTNGAGQGDWFSALQFGAAWVPRISGSLYGEVTALQQLYRYADLSGLSFNSLDIGGGLLYVFRDLGDLSAFARYNYNLLTDASASTSLFYQQTIRLGLQKPFVFSRAHSATVAFNTDLNLNGWPDYSLRNRFALLAGYQANLTRRLQASLFYQIAYMPFIEYGRRDWNQILSAGLAYNFTPWFSVNASLAASFNDSNDDFFTYSVLNTGAGVSAVVKF
ncbi:MAG: hypothetical protein ACO3J2_06875 [Chthoniobacterales bacterium]|jgi:hypothetical protein